MSTTGQGTRGAGRPRRWKGMAPEERDAQRRERLLQAALDHFGTAGYAATTVAELCATAGVATRSFYELFGSREALLDAAYERITHEIAGAMIAAQQSEPLDLRARVRAGVGAVIELLVADERKGRIVELEVNGVSPELERRRRAVTRSLAAILDQEIERMVELGLLPPQEKGLLTLLMVGGVTEILIDHLLTPRGRRRSKQALTDEITRLWLRILHAA